MNFDNVEVAEVVAAQIPFYQYVLAVGILAGLLLAIFVLPKLFFKYGSNNSNSHALNCWPMTVQWVAVLFLVGFSLTQAIAGITVYWQTMLANANAHEYFQMMRPAKLLGLSHAHLFGYTVLFGLTGLMVSGASLKPYTRGVLVAGMVLSAITDVGSWWLLKYFGPAFEIVTVGSGLIIGLCFFLSLFFIFKTMLCHSQETS
jgi:hypothetical protein